MSTPGVVAAAHSGFKAAQGGFSGPNRAMCFCPNIKKEMFDLGGAQRLHLAAQKQLFLRG
jgi:hypothetical protein